MQSVSAVQHAQPVLPAMHKPDRLAERINSLSHAQEYRLEKIPDGLIDSLPTEGLFMVTLWNRETIYIFMLWFVLSFFFLFFPRLISAAADWMSAILTHMVWP